MSAERELDAAGIHDRQLRADYLHCRALAAGHGRTYFLATRLLPPARRPAIHALYGFARTADDIVDETESPLTLEKQRAALTRFAADLGDKPDGGADVGAVPSTSPTEPVIRALQDTAARYRLDRRLFLDFLASMQMDLTITEYDTYADLERYMYGSAAVIGLQVLPVLGTVGPRSDAAEAAADLGVAFQLTNFIRDVGEDLARGRIYLPQESLRAFGVDRAALERGQVDARIRDLLRFEIARTRAIYARARPGIALLEPASRQCVEVAFRLYGDILGAVEAADYQVLRGPRISVPNRRRFAVAAPRLMAATVLGLGRRRRERQPA